MCSYLVFCFASNTFCSFSLFVLESDKSVITYFIKSSQKRNFQRNHPNIFLDPNQLRITECFNKISELEAVVERLVRENKELRENQKGNGFILNDKQPFFMRKLLMQALKNSAQNNHGKLYDEFILRASTYMWITMGRQAYETLRLNTPLPSIPTLQRYLGKEDPIIEGQLQTESIVDEIKNRNLSTWVWGAEDDTKLQEALKYDSKTNTIIGLQLPYDENGMPKLNFFKFSSMSVAFKYIQENRVAPYLKLISLRSLHPDSSNFILALWGTSGTDKHTDVLIRWEYYKKILRENGLDLIGNVSVLGLLIYVKLITFICRFFK